MWSETKGTCRRFGCCVFCLILEFGDCGTLSPAMAFLIQLVSLVVIAGTAIRKAEDADWKWANAGIVVGGIVLGILVPAVIGFIIQHAYFLPLMGPILAVGFGLLAATGAIAGNKWRAAGIRIGHKVQYTKNDKTVI